MNKAAATQHDAPDPELGGLITIRRRRAFNLTMAALLGVVGLGLIVGAIAIATMPATRNPSPPDPEVWIIMLVAACVLLVCAVVLALKARVALHFHERAVVKMVGRRVGMVLPYDEVTDFQFSLIRQHLHGMYVGTIMRLRIIGQGKRKASYDGNYKAKSKGLLRKTYESTDELEVVKDLISRAISHSLQEDLLNGQAVEWCGLATLSAEGLTPARGRHKKQLIPYSQIDRQTLGDGALSLFRVGEKKPFTSLSVNVVNFWPCYYLFLHMADLHAAIQEEPGSQRVT